MDKSSPTRYTHHHQPSLRGGAIDSSDDSVSVPLENLRWQKGLPQCASKHRRHQKQRISEAEGHEPTEKIRSFSWDPQLQKKEPLKSEAIISDAKIHPSRSGRTKVVKQHFGNVQQRTPPILEWDGEEDLDNQFSNQDLQQYMVKCHRELMKEFKDLKLSISRQIVNIQLDVDKILANQEAAPSRGFQDHASYRPGSAAEGNILELVDANQELPAYSSLKFRQELTKPASPSSGESYHLLSSKLESQYPEAQDGTHFESWPQEESRHMTSQNTYTAQNQSHVFRNLQNNPIYHVQRSADNKGGSSDSDTSESSIDLARFNYREAMSSLLETRQESDSRQPSSADELDNVGVSSRGARSQTITELQRKKSNGNSNVGSPGNTRMPDGGNQSHDLSSYMDSKLDNNGHTRSHSARTGRLDEHNRTTSNSEAHLAQILQSGSSKALRKDEVSMSSLLGTYTPKSRASHEDANVLPDNEPHLRTPGRNSPRSGEKKNRSASRPLFAEESGKTRWDNLSTTSSTSIYNRELSNQQVYRKGGAEQERFTYGREEPQNQHSGKGGAEQARFSYSREEPQNQQSGKAVADEQQQPTYTSEESQGQYDCNSGPDQGRSTYSREESQSQQYGKAEAFEQGRPTQASEQPQTRQYGKAVAAEQKRTKSQDSMVEKQGQGETFTLRGWASAFLEPPTEITIKTQEITLQTASPKTDYHSSGRDSPTEQTVLQESPERERHREKENGNQYAVRQFAGKSSKGGCAWTVSEPASSPNNDNKGSSANGTTTGKGRQKHYYPPANNH